MNFSEILQEILHYGSGLKMLELGGLIFGLLCVFFLIKESILTWPAGIIYVLISFVIFIQAKLYADFILHVFFLILNIYGWYYWVSGRKHDEAQVPVSTTPLNTLFVVLLASIGGIGVCGYLLNNFTDASLPYWDSATSVLSIAAMWLTAKKKIENWIIWLFVDVMATGIYFYKELYFYCALYFIYIVMAVLGYLAWKRSMNLTPAVT